MKTNAHIKASYKFFLLKESRGESFSLDEIAKATGWSIVTVKTYLTKKWEKILYRQKNGKYLAKINNYAEAEYEKMMSQKDTLSQDPFRPNLPSNVEELVTKARDAAVLAIDIYNRPITLFRSEGYIVMMIIAWTALLHAFFESKKVDYFYKDTIIDGDKKAWELNFCLKEVKNLITDAEKKNIEFFIQLRNKIEHRYVPELDINIFGECQALLLNFEALLIKQFGNYYALSSSLSLPLQTTASKNDAQIKTMHQFQKKHYEELRQYIDNFKRGLKEEILSDNKYCFRAYLIEVPANNINTADYSLKVVKYDPNNPQAYAGLKKCIELIKEKRIPVANQGKFRPSDVCAILNERLGKKITMDMHTRAWKCYKARKSGRQPEGCNPEFCQYDVVHKDYVYTDKWVEYLVRKLKNTKEFERVKNYEINK